MKLRTEKFRCALCGQFRRVGVTETRPKVEGDGEGSTSTAVCAPCVGKAGMVLGEGAEEAWDRLIQAGFAVEG